MKKPRQKGQLRLTVMLVSIVGFFLIIMSYVFMRATKDAEPKKEITYGSDIDTEVVTEKVEEVSQCVIRSMNQEEKSIYLYNITKDCNMSLDYTGASDIRNKYDEVISVSQLQTGTLVDVIYENGILKSLHNSKDAWEYTNVTKLIPDLEEKIIKLYGKKYRYGSNLFVQDKKGESALLSISAEDVLTVRGLDRTIYSITVVKGHGTVLLQNCEYFEGGVLTIGTKEYMDFTEGMRFLAPEGMMKIEIAKDKIVGTKKLKVKKDKEVVLDLAEFTPEPPKVGSITFNIHPFGAELYIDDAFVSYSNPVELEYGEHTIEVSLNGYQTYTGVYEVKSDADVVQIDLPEIVEEEEEEVTPTPIYPTQAPEESEESSESTQTPTSTSTPTPSEEKEEEEEEEDSKEETTPKETEKEEESEDKNDTTSEDVDRAHTIHIKSPTSVGLYINGIYQGVTPLTVEKPLGVTYITLIKQGYVQETHTIDIPDDNKNKTYTFPKLEPLPEE